MSRPLRVRVTPRSIKTEVIGYREGVLRIRLSAPPVDGAANTACCEFVAKLLGIPKSNVQVAKGAASREKMLSVEGFDLPWPWEKTSGEASSGS
jgi:uncharacterized protein (TIGR00251 family)